MVYRAGYVLNPAGFGIPSGKVFMGADLTLLPRTQCDAIILGWSDGRASNSIPVTWVFPPRSLVHPFRDGILSGVVEILICSDVIHYYLALTRERLSNDDRMGGRRN